MPTTSVPSLIEVAPVYVLALPPEIVNCPVPVLVKVPVDVPITPDSVDVPMDSTVTL